MSVTQLTCRRCSSEFVKRVRKKGFKERLLSSFYCRENIGGSGIVSDISINGCAFVTEVQLTEQSIIRLALRISGELQPVDIEAAVVRHVRQGRVGIEFLRVQEAERQRLQLFIRGLRRK
jgi:c-di-GMP-binding flagellar brake protein YcgR